MRCLCMCNVWGGTFQSRQGASLTATHPLTLPQVGPPSHSLSLSRTLFLLVHPFALLMSCSQPHTGASHLLSRSQSSLLLVRALEDGQLPRLSLPYSPGWPSSAVACLTSQEEEVDSILSSPRAGPGWGVLMPKTDPRISWAHSP